MTASVEDLLRASAMTYGHIQLFRDDAGWAVSVQHYAPKELDHERSFTLGIFDDPVDGMRKALIEDERRTRDLSRKYAAAMGNRPAPVTPPPAVSEPAQVDLEQYIAATADPMAGMFG